MRSPLLRTIVLLGLIAGLLSPAWSAPAGGQAGSSQGPPGLDVESPTSPEEAQSGLLKKQQYRFTNLLLRLGVYGPAVEALDKLVDATDDLPGLFTLQGRIVAVLEALGEHTTAIELGEKTISLMLQGKTNTPNARLMLALSIIRSARRASRPEVERRMMPDVARLAKTLDTPDGRLARFLIASYAFEEEYRRNPDIDPNAFLKRHDEVWALLQAVPRDARLAPFFMTWAGDAARIWMVITVRLGVKYPDGSTIQAQLLKRFEGDLGFLVKLMADRSDPELVVAVSEAAIDTAHEAIEAHQWDTAQSLLKNCEEILDAYEGELRKGMKAQGIDVDDSAAARTRARMLQEQAQLLMARDAKKNSAQAIQLLSRAADIAGKSSDQIRTIEVENEWSAALVHTQPSGWQATASARIDSALKLSRKLGYRPGVIVALGNRGELLAVKGDKKAAINDLKEAVAAIEAYINELGPASGERVRKSWSHIYDLLARLQVEAGQGQDAFTTLDKGKDLTTRGTLDNAAPRDPQLRASLQRAVEARDRTRAISQELTEQSARGNQQNVAHLSKLLASSKQQFFAELGNIRQRDPDYERLLAVRPVNFASIQDSIPADTVLVQVFPSAEKLYLFVVTSKTFKIVGVDAKREEIETLVREFRTRVSGYRPKSAAAFDWSSPEGKPVRDCITTLHAMLIDPIEKDLEGKDVVAFIPTGTLFYMPMQALAREQGGKLQFLVERKQVAVLAKASDIAQIREKPSATKGRLVAFGNPDGSLAGSQKEVQDLAAIFPGAQIYLGSDATAQKLLALQSGVAYLHLATHGVLDARDPNASYMVLAGTSDKNRLHVTDIFGLPLQGTRMVTLSACQTALGTSNPGSELSSLAEAFSIAGSPTVVASLWRVSDRSTRDLMVNFYQNLSKGMSRARALQQAQLQLLRSEQFSHPFYWAPFVIMGDWR